jgi:hypothetical protein
MQITSEKSHRTLLEERKRDHYVLSANSFFSLPIYIGGLYIYNMLCVENIRCNILFIEKNLITI